MLWEVLHSYFWDWMWFNIYNLLFIGIVNIPTYSAWMLIKWDSVSAKCLPLFLVSCRLTQWAISSHLKLAIPKWNYQWKHPLIAGVPFSPCRISGWLYPGQDEHIHRGKLVRWKPISTVSPLVSSSQPNIKKAKCFPRVPYFIDPEWDWLVYRAFF